MLVQRQSKPKADKQTKFYFYLAFFKKLLAPEKLNTHQTGDCVSNINVP